MNEAELTALSDNECEFYSEVELDDEMLKKKYVEVTFLGLDTICDIYQ